MTSHVQVMPTGLTHIEAFVSTEDVPANSNHLYSIKCTDIPGYTPVAISGFYAENSGASSMTVYRFSVVDVTPTDGSAPYKNATLGLKNTLDTAKSIKVHVFVLYVRDL